MFARTCPIVTIYVLYIDCRVIFIFYYIYINIINIIIYINPICMCGSSSSVGIAADWGLDDPGSNPGGDEIFRPSRRALGSTQPSVKWVPSLSRG